LNNSLFVPTAFHKGFGVRPYGSLLLEYVPGRIWGAMLNLGYDGRGAKFKDVIAPCNCPATLKTNPTYASVEPSIRLGSATSNFYFYAGPRLAINMKKGFSYTQLKQTNTDSELSGIRKTLVSGQIGVGYDFKFYSGNNNMIILAPFLSFHPYFGQNPRNIESWTITTVRSGIALKFGKGSKAIIKEIPIEAIPIPATPIAVIPTAVVPVRDVAFSVREPKTVLTRQVSETLPLRNSIFFDEGSTEIPNRYVMLTKDQASGFKEESLQKEQSSAMLGRSARQLNVYHNILNILGDRLRSNPGTSISLSGASLNGPKEGKVFAELIKQYLVTIFGINSSRITTQGRTKPLIPSEQPGGTKELVLLRAGDRRVDVEIESTSPELLTEVGGGMMKPVQFMTTQIDPLDSHVIFYVAGAQEVLKSWSLDITDYRGTIQHYGPFTRDQESMPGKTILGDLPEGNYNVSMLGETKNGVSVRKEATIHLLRQNDMTEKGFRYSILFDFDKANAIASYEKFLTGTVLPSISAGSTVIIHGHTDIIGEADHNLKLSQDRAQQTQQILERALSNAGTKNVKFETMGYGEDLNHAPFENGLPEERFYNRTVIIDIIPAKLATSN